MNYAIVFAGGVGSRMQSPKLPKQLNEVCGIPIIVHTINHLQAHPDIDKVMVVCLEPYIDFMKELLNKYNLSKVFKVVAGGRTGQESICKGLQALDGIADDDDIVILHDGVRPIIDADLISRNIDSVKQYGNAISCSSATETICLAGDEGSIKDIMPRDKCMMGRAPQSFRYADIYNCHKRANQEGYTTAIDSASMLHHYGYPLHFVQCSHFNIKITTPNDLFLFTAFLKNSNENCGRK